MLLRNIKDNALVSILCVFLSIFVFWLIYVYLDLRQAEIVAKYGLYWISTGLFACFILCCHQALSGKYSFVFKIIRHHWIGVLFAFIVSCLLQIHEPHEYKILYDEYVLTAVSQSFHNERICNIATVAYNYYDDTLRFSQYIDKRPVLYPYLLSLVHDIVGYNTNNAFIINYIFSFIFLLLIYCIGTQFANHFTGWIGVTLIATIPLFSQMATSAGYDLLNGLLLLFYIITARLYLLYGGKRYLNLFIISGAMFASCRYESLVYLIIIPLFILYRFKKYNNEKISLLVFALPLFIISPLLSNYIYTHTPAFFELDSGSPFSLSYLIPNLQHAIFYFFNYDCNTNNSLIVSVLGCLSVLSCLYYIIRRVITRVKIDDVSYLYICFICPATISFSVFMLCFWSYYDDPMASRFSFTQQIMMVFSVILMLNIITITDKYKYIIFVSLCIYYMVFTVPNLANHITTNQLINAQEMDWSLSKLADVSKKDSLIVCRSSLPMICHGYSSINITQLNKNYLRLKKSLERGMFKDVYLFQRQFMDSATGLYNTDTRSSISPHVNLVLIDEILLRYNVHYYFYKVSSISDQTDKDVKELSDFPYESDGDMFRSFFSELP